MLRFWRHNKMARDLHGEACPTLSRIARTAALCRTLQRMSEMRFLMMVICLITYSDRDLFWARVPDYLPDHARTAGTLLPSAAAHDSVVFIILHSMPRLGQRSFRPDALTVSVNAAAPSRLLRESPQS